MVNTWDSEMTTKCRIITVLVKVQNCYMTALIFKCDINNSYTIKHWLQQAKNKAL